MWYYFTNHLYYLFVLVKKRKALDEVISVLVTGHPEVSIYDNFLFLTNSMERALRPDKFDVLPDTGTSEKDFKFWLKTLENFLAILPQDNLDKLKVMINHVSPAVYDYVSECTTYDAAVELLKTIYIKPTNVVFARHLLSTRQQKPEENFDQYLQELKLLSKNCQFEAVTANDHRDQYIRDSFIAGLRSTSIRQRLLEENKVTLADVHEKARTLELAHKNVESYGPKSEDVFSAALKVKGDDKHLNGAPKAENVVDPTKCWNCGNDRHPKSQCPAKDVICYGCGKKGHFGKLCRNPKLSNNATAASIQYPTLT